jgi:hypothetical protein
VEQRGVGVVDVLIGGSVADAERGPVAGMEIVLRLPRLEVIGLDGLPPKPWRFADS